MISFVMMAKNMALYIEAAIAPMLEQQVVPWELIVIDDHSDDGTYELVSAICARDSRVRLFSNPFVGKVMGTNYGFEQSTGSIIKCVDSDDLLLGDFFSHYENMNDYDAHLHSSTIVDKNLSALGEYHANSEIIDRDYEYVAANLLSVPKFSWSFSRPIAEKVFPIPEELPFEDVWMTVLIKKHAKEILNIGESLYLYRQHDEQTFGGIFNYSRTVRIFRAKRLIRLIDIFVRNDRIIGESGLSVESFKGALAYNEFLSAQNPSVLNLVKGPMTLRQKAKAALIAYFPESLVRLVLKVKWIYDRAKN